MAIYRQIAAVLRIQDRETVRLRGASGVYLDSEECPTLVDIGEGDGCDVAGMLRIGAIAPYSPPGDEPPPTRRQVLRAEAKALKVTPVEIAPDGAGGSSDGENSG